MRCQLNSKALIRIAISKMVVMSFIQHNLLILESAVHAKGVLIEISVLGIQVRRDAWSKLKISQKSKLLKHKEDPNTR